MKRLLLIALPLMLFLGLATMASPQAVAVDVINQACTNKNASQRPAVCSDNNTTGRNPLFGPGGILTTVVQFLAIIIGVAAVFTIIIAGLRIIMSNGDPATLNTGRNAIIYAIAGLVIAASAQAIIIFVLSRVGV